MRVGGCHAGPLDRIDGPAFWRRANFDLLRTIANHVGMLISHSRLAEDRKAAAEMEALHRFSAFCLHDLKNLAARLSIVVKNAEVFGEDLAFQRSAMKTVAGTVPKMM